MTPNRRHRVLYIQKPTGGGSMVSLYELVRGLDKNIFEPIVIFYTSSSYQKQFEDLGVRVDILNEGSSVKGPPISKRNLPERLGHFSRWLARLYRELRRIFMLIRWGWPQVKGLTEFIRKEGIDLVHHNNSLVANCESVLATWMAGVPQICHIRDLDFLILIDKWLIRWVNQFIYISGAVQESYQNQGVPIYKGQVVYNPINIVGCQAVENTFAVRREFGITDKEILITNVGRITRWKGQNFFLEAVHSIIKTHSGIKVLLVGELQPGPLDEIYFQNLRKLVEDFGLENHIIFTGFRSDIQEIIGASNIIVHSACAPEPFGRVVAEGMAAGCPVVATNAGGVPEIIEDGVDGLLVPPGDIPSMSKAILKLIEDPALRKKMGQCAKDNVARQFSVNQHVTAIEGIYRRKFSLI